MSIEERLIAAVTPVVPVCVHGVYTGTEEVYCTFNLSQTPDSFGDDEPDTGDPRALRRQLRRALLEAELGAAIVEDASDADNVHLVFEFEALDLEV